MGGPMANRGSQLFIQVDKRQEVDFDSLFFTPSRFRVVLPGLAVFLRMPHQSCYPPTLFLRTPNR